MIIPTTFNQIIVPYVSGNCKSKNKVIKFIMDIIKNDKFNVCDYFY